jgi:hypothetical protein
VEDCDEFDARFQRAVALLDTGDLPALQRLLSEDPSLARERLETPGAWLREEVGDALDGFFARPYLLWFVAEDPVRTGRLPADAPQLAEAILRAAHGMEPERLREQVDHALRLVAWSRVARECGVQEGLVEVLVDAGAALEGMAENALVNGNFGAAEQLVRRGAPLTFPTALCLERWEDARRLAAGAGAEGLQQGLVLAALNGKAEAVGLALELGADRDAPSADLYAHGTPLHHAVYSGSAAAVRVLVEAGAELNRRDTVYGGTPLGWAEHGKQAEIAGYLRAQGARL